MSKTFKFYTCCPKAGCSCNHDAIAFLKSWGIEPELGHDKIGHFLKINVPKAAKEFWDALGENIGRAEVDR